MTTFEDYKRNGIDWCWIESMYDVQSASAWMQKETRNNSSVPASCQRRYERAWFVYSVLDGALSAFHAGFHDFGKADWNLSYIKVPGNESINVWAEMFMRKLIPDCRITYTNYIMHIEAEC